MSEAITSGEDDTYLRLSRFLDTMPGGFPRTESGVEIEILKKFFTVPEADMLMQMSVTPETALVIATRAGLGVEEAEAMLESLSRQGCCLRVRKSNETLYMATSFVVGIYEYHLKAIDRELAEMFEEYLPYLGKQWTTQKTQQVRIVPVGAAIDTKPLIANYDRVKEIAQCQENIAVAECICRREQGLLGHECNHPHETCIRFGMLADYCVENETGRRISKRQCLKIIDRAQESGLVLMTTNCIDIVNVCSCCSCCCAVLKSVKALGRPADYTVTSFQACIDPDVCQLCGACLKRCPMDAIVEGDDFSSVDNSRCIGCGLCVATCPESAIALDARSDAVTPPLNVAERNMKMLEERGLR